MPTVTVSNELLDLASSLIYRKWAEAFDNLKAVKKEKDDGDPDWAAFHEIRLKNAIKEEEQTKRILDEITPLSPTVRAYNEYVRTLNK